MQTLIANARMYAVTPAVRDAWRALFDRVGRRRACRSSTSTTPLRHRSKSCGRAAISAPPSCAVSRSPRQRRSRCWLRPPSRRRRVTTRHPVYCTDFVVRAADSAFARLRDTFGARIGWTVSHSQSGFNAARHHLLPLSSRQVRAAVRREHRPPGDAEARDRGRAGRHDRCRSARFLRPRSAETARARDGVAAAHHRVDRHDAIPPLVASPATPADTVERLRATLLAAASRSGAGADSRRNCCSRASRGSTPRTTTASRRKPRRQPQPAMRCRASQQSCGLPSPARATTERQMTATITLTPGRATLADWRSVADGAAVRLDPRRDAGGRGRGACGRSHHREGRAGLRDQHRVRQACERAHRRRRPRHAPAQHRAVPCGRGRRADAARDGAADDGAQAREPRPRRLRRAVANHRDARSDAGARRRSR